MSKRRKFSEEFKREALELTRQPGGLTIITSGVSHWLNEPPIIIHALVLSILYHRVQMRERAQSKL